MRTTVLIGVMLGTLAYLILWLGLPGMVVWIALIGLPVVWFGKRKEASPEKKKLMTTGYIQPNGKVLWNGKLISQQEAEWRGLKLEYPPKKPKKKPDFWKSWRSA